MVRFLPVLAFILVLGMTTYIYLNFESVNFIQPSPLHVTTGSSPNNRLVPGDYRSIESYGWRFWGTTPENAVPTAATAWHRNSMYTEQLPPYDPGEINYVSSFVDVDRESELETKEEVLPDDQTLTDLPLSPLPPPQEWVNDNVKKVLSELKLALPPKTRWAMADFITLLKSYYSPTTDVIYAGIPKSGCTNWKFTILQIENMLKAQATPGPKVHYVINKLNLANSLNKFSHKSLNGKYSFTVIRNPWSRMVSGYNDKFASSRSGKWQGGRVALFILQKYRDRRITIQDIKVRGMRPTFHEFLKHLVHDSFHVINAHFRPQYSLLSLHQVEYNFIGALEHAEVQSASIFAHFMTTRAADIEVPGPYDSSKDPRTERSTLFAKEWLPKVPQLLLDKLYKRYKPDFMLYNYSNYTDPMFPFPVYPGNN